MANPGANVPHRTPRKRALEIGTDSRGLSEPKYNSQAGLPANQRQGGRYRDVAEESAKAKSSPSRDTVSPFKGLK